MSPSPPPDRLANRRWYGIDCRRIKIQRDGDDNESTARLNSDPVVMKNTTADFDLSTLTEDYHQHQPYITGIEGRFRTGGDELF